MIDVHVRQISISESNVSHSDRSPERFAIDPDGALKMWPGPPLPHTEDLYTLEVDLAKPLHLKTHVFGHNEIVPYRPLNCAKNGTPIFPLTLGEPIDAAGHVVPVEELQKEAFKPGQVFIALRSGRPLVRRLNKGHHELSRRLSRAWNFHHNDMHSSFVIGTNGGPCPLHIPAVEDLGTMGKEMYPSLYFSLRFPSFPALGAAEIAAFHENIATMALVFATQACLPEASERLKGTDSILGTTPDELIECARRAILAALGDADSKDWFRHPDHRIYCGEFIHLAVAAGIHCPLNEAYWVSRLIPGDPAASRHKFAEFESAIRLHNEATDLATSQAFSRGQASTNRSLQKLKLSLSAPDLRPIATYAPDVLKDAVSVLMPFELLTPSQDIACVIESYLGPKAIDDISLKFVALSLREMKGTMIEMLQLDRQGKEDLARRASEVIDRTIKAVLAAARGSGKEWPRLRTLLAPLDEICDLPRRSDGRPFVSAFPSLFHFISSGDHPNLNGILSLDFLGHGLPIGLVVDRSATSTGQG